jgi:hypothetical protein
MVALPSLVEGVRTSEGEYFDLFFSDTPHEGVWLASAALALAVDAPFTAADLPAALDEPA